jgi:uncharacterized protein (DUF4415 family)
MTERRENIVRVSAAEAKLMKGQTDWARFDAMTDEDIAKAVAEDPDAAPLDIDWDKASLVIPATAKDIITLRVDADVLEWLRATGKGYQTRINQVLRAWYEASVRQEKAISAGIKVRLKRHIKTSQPKSSHAKAQTATERKAAAKKAALKKARDAAAKRATPAKRRA